MLCDSIGPTARGECLFFFTVWRESDPGLPCRRPNFGVLRWAKAVSNARSNSAPYGSSIQRPIYALNAAAGPKISGRAGGTLAQPPRAIAESGEQPGSDIRHFRCDEDEGPRGLLRPGRENKGSRQGCGRCRAGSLRRIAERAYLQLSTSAVIGDTICC